MWQISLTIILYVRYEREREHLMEENKDVWAHIVVYSNIQGYCHNRWQAIKATDKAYIP